METVSRSPRPSRSSNSLLAGVVAAAFALVCATAAPNAHAETDADLLTLTCSSGKVSVTAKGPWYVNDKAPWKWDRGKKIKVSSGDHEKHGPDHGKAEFEGATCEGTVKAFICNGDQCKGPIALNVH